MGTDNLFKKRKGNKRKRKEENRQSTPYRYLIVCEGSKTEPNYFQGIKRKIEEKYQGKVEVKNKIELDIEGTGRNTEDLVNFALKTKSLSEMPYGHVWVVFDKDDFTNEQFNNAITKAHNHSIKTAWSNESIELWFLLHYEYMNSAIHRYQYIGKLNTYFKKFGINNGKYEKNLENIFELLCSSGNVGEAIKGAKRLIEEHNQQGLVSESQMNPSTTVYQLVEELLEHVK